MASDDPYANVREGKLKLKRDDGIKKKKKAKSKKLSEEQMQNLLEDGIEKKPELSSKQKRTKAELAFLEQKEKNQAKRILEKATMTHKERVEKFNQHLDSLTEHFDIPKVSWTK
ncbi:protein FAM32A-like [Coccinella septempunctata]|uniref:protein FAM32A-like n=1 Tax=Coccinella septempunctata TaxID=41139 RepID=UPI001D06D2B2|nr:protein FAM32A-like [Coccinella septempunctata]